MAGAGAEEEAAEVAAGGGGGATSVYADHCGDEAFAIVLALTAIKAEPTQLGAFRSIVATWTPSAASQPTVLPSGENVA